MGNNKRKKRGSSYSVRNDSDMVNEEFDVRSSIDGLTNAMEAGFAGLRAEIEGRKGELKSLKEGISFTKVKSRLLRKNQKKI